MTASPGPPARTVLASPLHLLAFGFGAGLSPRAPGTVGTLVAVPLWWALAQLPGPAYGLALVAVCGAGVWVCGESARRLGVHDHPGIVFDEFAGFFVAATPLHPGLGLVAAPIWPWLLAAFVLFRVFDIAKPWPIGWLDRRVPGGSGILLDDLVAGLYAAMLLFIAAWWLRG